ncbi:DoxX family protein [Thermobifida halotolerans]|uniref:DoxX family protein n=1 Tax=Thermobifida halotolerans TaxID=483545 RepID=A0A399G7G8_9ACTN|nr:DoxX family protein [Thermobifida halotolerans]UOE20322.1 DoxX family protein [Thermobifida halotolerans]
MAPLIALVGGFVVLRLLGLAGVDALDHWQTALRGGLALMFVVTATAHFVQPRRGDLVAMVPPRLPRPALLVTVTGVLELVGAAALLLPPLAPHAALCLALLMLAMFPANVSAARRGLTLAGRPVTPLPLRTVLQVVFVAAAVAAAVPV